MNRTNGVWSFMHGSIRIVQYLIDKNSSVSSNHITRVHKDWFLMYGGKKYFNPGLSK